MSGPNSEGRDTGEISWPHLHGEVKALRREVGRLRDDIKRDIHHRTLISRFFTTLVAVALLAVIGTGLYVERQRVIALEEMMERTCERHVELREVFIDFIDTVEQEVEDAPDDHPLLDLRAELMRNPCPSALPTSNNP